MATSGTIAFTLDIAEIIEEAGERCGFSQDRLREGYFFKTARRSLDLLMTEWANTGVNLWTLEQNTIALADGTNTYTNIPADTVDILDAVSRTTEAGGTTTDVPMERISTEEYLNRTNKLQEGRPIQFSLLRGNDAHTLFVYPTPDTAYTFVYWQIRYMEDTGDLAKNVDMPKRLLPALIAGLAWQLAIKYPAQVSRDEASGQFVQSDGVSRETRAELRQIYVESFALARQEDRDRASMMIYPRVRKYV